MARGGVKQSTAGAPVEGPWALPDGWRWSTIDEVCSYLSRGRSPKYVESNGTRIINQKCVRWRGLDAKWSKRTSTESAAKLAEDQFLREFDILWNSTGTGTIGRACLIKQADLDEPTVVDTHVTLLRPGSVHPRWLHYWLQVPFVQKAVAGTGSTNQVELARSTILAMPMPIPSMALQEICVARIDELFAEIDDGEAALGRARDDLATWRKALLKASISGELTADWRGMKSDLGSETPESATTLGNNLDEWTRTTVGEVASLQGGPAFKSVDYSLEGVFLVRIGDINGGSVTASLQSARLPFPFADENRRFIVREGDILIAMSGATTAKFGRYAGVEPALLNQRVGRFTIRNEETLSTDYLAIWLGHQQAIILKAAYGGAQPNISAGAIEAMPIVLPPRAEQSEIVARLHSSLRQVSERSAELGELAAASSALRQSILAVAFRGDLA